MVVFCKIIVLFFLWERNQSLGNKKVVSVYMTLHTQMEAIYHGTQILLQTVPVRRPQQTVVTYRVDRNYVKKEELKFQEWISPIYGGASSSRNNSV